MNDTVAAIEKIEHFRLHLLGFFYLLQSQGNGWSRRVHVWLPETERTVQNVANDRHQHSFDIHSTVRMGCMRSEIFRFTESPEGSEREFKVTYGNDRSSVSPTGRTGVLEITAFFESNAGSCYFLKAGVIHRVSITVRPCITFLTTEEHGVPIFSYGDDPEEPAFERRLANPAEKDEIVRLLELVR
jgi:hypothetical protein